MAGGALEKRDRAKLNRAAGFKPLADGVDGQAAEGADLARYRLGEDSQILERRGELAIVFDKMDMNLVKIGFECRVFHRPHRDHGAVFALPFHEQSHKTVECRQGLARKDRKGVAAARLAPPKAKTLSHFGRGGEGAGIAGKRANRYRMHENKTRTFFENVNRPIRAQA
jgi:hypothetical protein